MGRRLAFWGFAMAFPLPLVFTYDALNKEPTALRIDIFFGIVAYAAHLNGFVRREGRDYVWVSRRAASKNIDPGRLDNLVGGRIAAGMSVDETLRKEAWEDAYRRTPHGKPVELEVEAAC